VTSHANRPAFIPVGRARAEIRVINSRFLASAALTPSVEAARSFIGEVRAEMPDASHHVYAYVIGHGASITLGMSDDGEPSGTAGRPVLAILRGSGLGDVTLVVTRYFGGTLLGTGGLVHAYGDAAREVLELLPREEKIARRTILIAMPYTYFELVQRLASTYQATIDEQQFASDVTVTITLPIQHIAAFRAALSDGTGGVAEIVEDVDL
jgi:uncharacterized YigZ family protein